MTLADYFIKYVDAKIEYEFSSREPGSDGYYQSAIPEREKMERAREELKRVVKSVQILIE